MNRRKFIDISKLEHDVQFRACAIWKRFCPLSLLRGGGVVVHISGRLFDWGNQVCFHLGTGVNMSELEYSVVSTLLLLHYFITQG